MGRSTKKMKIGFTCGTFDFLHAGHVLMLREAKKHCDYLIVGLQVNPSMDRPDKKKPVESLLERQIKLRACKYVDDIIVYETENDLITLLQVLDIDVRIVGEDHRNDSGKWSEIRNGICKDRGIEIYYNKRRHNYSSSMIRTRL